MLAHAQRCGVCGWQGEDEVCPRCGTVLLRGRALCQRCGKVFEGPLARCDACGGAVDTPGEPEAARTIERLTRLPGVDRETAKRLLARGIREPADLLKLALPERTVRRGLHRAIARRVMLEDLRPAKRIRKAVACPTCGAPRPVGRPWCPTCGAPWSTEPSPDEVRKWLADVVGEVYDLAADPDFQGLPPDLREEILEAFQGAGIATFMESEYTDQLREWRERGLDTRELERILREEGADAFRAKFVKIVRCQALKSRHGDRFACPLCDEDLPPAAEACGNCGARFW